MQARPQANACNNFGETKEVKGCLTRSTPLGFNDLTRPSGCPTLSQTTEVKSLIIAQTEVLFRQTVYKDHKMLGAWW